MAVMEPDYNSYPQSGGALVPSGNGGGALAPAGVFAGGESDSGLPGSQGLSSNFITDLLGPAYKKYPYPPYVVTMPAAPQPTPAAPSPSPTRGGGIPPVA